MVRRILMTLCSLVLLVSLALVTPVQGQVMTTAVAHDLAGKENCLLCHAEGAMTPVPDIPTSHEGRENEHCMWCHAADSPMVTIGASYTIHDLEGKDNCMLCHAVGVMPPAPDIPATTHEGRVNETCLWCHKTDG